VHRQESLGREFGVALRHVHDAEPERQHTVVPDEHVHGVAEGFRVGLKWPLLLSM
jgi:hypothetical protein